MTGKLWGADVDVCIARTKFETCGFDFLFLSVAITSNLDESFLFHVIFNLNERASPTVSDGQMIPLLDPTKLARFDNSKFGIVTGIIAALK